MKLHIALVSRLSGSGGIAVYNRTLASALTQIGHDVTIVTSQAAKSSPVNVGYTVTDVVWPDAKWLKLPAIRYYARSIRQFIYAYSVSNRLAEIHRTKPLDVIEFAEIEAEAFAYLRRKQRQPVVVRCHTPTFVLQDYHLASEMPYSTRFTVAMEQYCIRHADALSAPSKDMAETIEATCNLKQGSVRAIPNPVDVEKYARSLNLPPEVDDNIIVLHIGRLERIKGIQVLVDAIPQILQQEPRVQFVFVGAARSVRATEYWRNRLTEAGNSSGRQDRVQLLGFLTESEMINWYHRADIAVVPSLNYESFSYTCAQAMAASLPVITSHIGGIPETVRHGIDGILIQPGDVSGLAEATISLGQDAARRRTMGEHGKTRSQVTFRADIVAQQLLDQYRKLL